MPIRVKSRWSGDREASPSTGHYAEWGWNVPQLGPDEAFGEVVKKLSFFFADAIDLPSSFDQLRTTSAGDALRVLVDHLSRTCTNPAIVNALLALRWHYVAETGNRPLSQARANACEIVAWRFLARQSERDAVDYCLHEVPGKDALFADPITMNASSGNQEYDEEANERSPLLAGPLASSTGGQHRSVSVRRAEMQQAAIPKLTLSLDLGDEDPRDEAVVIRDRSTYFKNLNTLEIAVIADAKHFLCQHIVQKIVTGIWHGEIVFWDSVSANSTKKPRYYNVKTADPYSRLRVPKYLKAWEVAFFIIFLVLYYSVVVERSFTHIPTVEIVFYLWLVSFLWDEFQEWADAGVFYMSDIWNLFDMLMISIGIVFAVLRIVGIATLNEEVNDVAFDILSLEALLVMPRIGSFLSLSPYWGTLIPCLKEMGKDFIKFIILVIIIYLGFLTTFSLVARDSFTLETMTWDITKIFYGNTGIGFDIMRDIDRSFGPPLMILFITLSSILLTGSLTGMLSNSFSRVMAQAREEYIYIYSVYVLEAATSTRLTHFYPPFNLVSLVFFRPWQIIFAKDDRFRHGRVVALKVTHFPIVSLIVAYEWFWRRVATREKSRNKGNAGQSQGRDDDWAGFSGNRARSGSEAPKRYPHGSNKDSRHGTRGGRSGRNIGSSEGRPRGVQGRRFSDQLSPDARPAASGLRMSSSPGSHRVLKSIDDGGWSGTSEDEGDARSDAGPSNAELMGKIDQLTMLVQAMQQQMKTSRD